MESVNVTMPDFELTFTDGIETMRVVSKTLPEIQTWHSVDLTVKRKMKIVKICFKKMNKRVNAWLVVNIKL